MAWWKVVLFLALQVVVESSVSVNSFEDYKDAVKAFESNSIGETAGTLSIDHITVAGSEPNKPNVGVICNVGGNRLSAVALCLDLIESARGTGGKLAPLLESHNIHVLPNLNADGSKKAYVDVNKGKENGDGVVLETSFPDLRNSEEVDTSNYPPEIKTVLEFLELEQFNLLLTIDSEFEGIFFPLFHSDDPESEGTLIHNIMTNVARNATRESETLINSPCWMPANQGFHYFSEPGTLEDYTYLKYGIPVYRVGVSCSVGADTHNLPLYEGLIATLISSASLGARGRVTPPGSASGVEKVRVACEKHVTYTNNGGYYWLPLPDGEGHDLTFTYGKFRLRGMRGDFTMGYWVVNPFG
eukprot:sb/3466079/